MVALRHNSGIRVSDGVNNVVLQNLCGVEKNQSESGQECV